MSTLVYCANMPELWEMSGRDVYLDTARRYVSLRRTDIVGNYARGGTYKSGDFKSYSLSASLLNSFFGVTVSASDCKLGFRISTDGGQRWQYFNGQDWVTLGGARNASGDYLGDIGLHMLIGDNYNEPEWMDESQLHEGLLTLPVGNRDIAVWVKMYPLDQDHKPVFNWIAIDFVENPRDNFLDDSVRSVSMYLQDNYYFDDRVIKEIDRADSYTLPYTTRTDPDGNTVPASTIVEYVRAYNITDDPMKATNVVSDWSSDGVVNFTSEQDGYVEFEFGHRPSVHVETKPIIQHSDEVALIIAVINVEEVGPYEDKVEINWWDHSSRVYKERWAEFRFNLMMQAHRTEQAMRMEEGIRRLIEQRSIFSEGLGRRLKWTLRYEETTTPSRVTNELTVVDVPLRFGRFRSIGAVKESKLATDIDINIVLIERSAQYEASY